MTSTDPHVTRALAQLDQFIDIYPKLMRTLEARAEERRQKCLDLGVDEETYQAADDDERMAILGQHHKEVIPKVRRHYGIPADVWRMWTYGEQWNAIDVWRAEVRDQVFGEDSAHLLTLLRFMRTDAHDLEYGRDLGDSETTWRSYPIEILKCRLIVHARTVMPRVLDHYGVRLTGWLELPDRERLDLMNRWRAEVRDA